MHNIQHTVATFNSCTKCMANRAKYTTARPIATHFPHPCIDAWMTLQLKQRVLFVRLSYFLDMLSMGVCITRRWQTTSRIMQELNSCTTSPSLYIHRPDCFTTFYNLIRSLRFYLHHLWIVYNIFSFMWISILVNYCFK